MGEACSGMPSTLWAVIDMYGQCARVSVVYAAQSIDQQVQSSGLSCGLTHACMSFSQQARTGVCALCLLKKASRMNWSLYSTS